MSSKRYPGVLDDESAAAALDALAAGSPHALDAALADTLHCVASSLAPIHPPAALKERLLAAVGAVNRFEDLTAPAAAFYDLPAEGAARLLQRIDSAVAWIQGPSPGSTCIAVDAGRGLAGKITMILRVPSGGRFPPHVHVGGAEHGLVLQGWCIEDDGVQYHRGESFVNPGESTHGFSVPSDGPDFIVALRLDGAVMFAPPPAG